MWLCALAVSLLFRWALLTVPYRYTPPEVISGSYYFGYNNRVHSNDRLHLAVAGRLPYRGLEFIYGAGMLYVPAQKGYFPAMLAGLAAVTFIAARSQVFSGMFALQHWRLQLSRHASP